MSVTFLNIPEFHLFDTYGADLEDLRQASEKPGKSDKECFRSKMVENL